MKVSVLLYSQRQLMIILARERLLIKSILNVVILLSLIQKMYTVQFAPTLYKFLLRF